MIDPVERDLHRYLTQESKSQQREDAIEARADEILSDPQAILALGEIPITPMLAVALAAFHTRGRDPVRNLAVAREAFEAVNTLAEIQAAEDVDEPPDVEPPDPWQDCCP